MDEPITLSQAFEQAQSTLQSSSKEESKGEIVEPAATTEEPAKETEVVTEEKAETKPEETDFEKVDPKSLPPELKSQYDNLMKGFTKGRQKDSEARRLAEQERDELKRQLMDLKKQSTDSFSELSQEQVGLLTPQEQFQYFQALSEYKAGKAVEAAKIDEYRNQALVDYESADPRLQRPTDAKPNEKYDRFMDSAIGAALDQALDDYIQLNGTEIGFPHREKLTELIEEYDQHMKSRYQGFISEQNQRLREAEEKNSKSSPKTSPAKATPKNPSLSEALKIAREKAGF